MNKKYRKRKVPKYFFIISLVLFLSIGVGYSVIYSNLSLQGNVTKKANTWNILFQNPVFDEGSITTPLPTITGGTNMTMNVNLTAPGQKYAFVVDLTNNGNVPAIIKTLNIAEISEDQAKYLRWKVEYEDESIPAVGDVLKAGETKKLHILLEYKKLRATDLYPKDNVNLNLSIAMNYYLPEETYNTVTITKNGSTKTIQVSNLEQETTLTDIPIESADQVIACNNGVEPSTNNENQIVLNKVKQNATCRIETSLADAVTNSGTEVTNMAVLQNAVTNNAVTISSGQNVNFNLNGKKYTFDLPDDAVYNIANDGNLTIIGKKENSEIESLDYSFLRNNSGILYINGGKYVRINDYASFGNVIYTGNKVMLKNASFVSDNVVTIGIHETNSIVDIDNCYIENQNASAALRSCANNSVVNIRNTTINSFSCALQIMPDNSTTAISSTYLCNSKLIPTYSDIYDITDNAFFYYSSNNVFKDGTNTPSIFSDKHNRLIKSDIACAE